MTKSQMFKKAHEIARATKEIAGSYRIAFACALKDLYRGEAEMEQTIEQKLVEAGAEAWENYGYKRIYLNDSIVRGLGFAQGTNGKWTKGETRLTSRAMNKIIGRGFFDCQSNAWNLSKCDGVCVEEKAAFLNAI